MIYQKVCCRTSVMSCDISDHVANEIWGNKATGPFCWVGQQTRRTADAPMLHEVRFYNSEQKGTAHHFYSLDFSSIWTGKISLSRIPENSFETHDW